MMGAHDQQQDPLSSDDDSSSSPFDVSGNISLIRAIIDSQHRGKRVPSASASASPSSVDVGPHAFIILAIIGPQQSGILNSVLPSADFLV